MRYFLDTSALVKIYHKEEGSEKVLDVYNKEKIIISELSVVEFLSAVYRKYREEEIEKDTVDAVWSKFKNDLEERYNLVKFSPPVIEISLELLHKHGGKKSIRTLDSLQLSFFLHTLDRKNDTFLCADKRLNHIAKAEDVLVIDAKD